MACQRAAQYTMIKGIIDVLGEKTFDKINRREPIATYRISLRYYRGVAENDKYDWIPGEMGYLKNPKEKGFFLDSG